MMNAPTRFGWYRSSRWDFEENQPQWKKLKEKAQQIVDSEAFIIGDYSEMGYTSLRSEGHNLYWYSEKRIPEYLDKQDYANHSLEDWVEHARMLRTINLLEEAKSQNLAKYGFKISPFFIGKIDQQYARLKEKSTPVIKRFLELNENNEEGIYGRLFRGSNKEINLSACRRVLIERGKILK